MRRPGEGLSVEGLGTPREWAGSQSDIMSVLSGYAEHGTGVPHEPAGLEHIDTVQVSRCPQVLVAELHRRALVEYVRPLLRGRLRCRSARTRSRVAGRLREDAAQLQRLFRRLVSARLGWGNRGAEWG